MATALVRWSTLFCLLVLVAPGVHCQSYSAIPRWGQASAIIYDRLFVFGGKTDPEHQYTYTSAPNSNDLLSLDLSSSFALSTPPWTYISGSQNISTSQGPAVSFHTLTPYTSSDLLLFGGDPGFSMIGTNADSAWLLNIGGAFAPSWSPKVAGWASEPIRRIYHAATSASGAIYILGGQKADGSQIGFPDPYLFNAVGDNGSPTFVPLPSSPDSPAGLFGHAAHVLPGGMLLVFGGFSSSSDAPSPFATIYTLNTTSASPVWSIQNASGTIPTPRRGFASALLANGKIIIHGGADAALQTLYSDGAVLDTTQTPMSWSPIEVLSATLGPRVGHFATAVQNQVLFGLGWAGNAAASANLALYDFASGTFQSTFTPPPGPVSITTLPAVPTAPGGSYPTSGANVGQGGSGSFGTPTQSIKGPSPSGPGNGGDRGGQDAGPDMKPRTTGVVIGSVLGFLALVGLAGSGVYYTLRQRERRTWMTDNDPKTGRWTLMPEGDPWDTVLYESPTQPGQNVQMAGTGWNGQPRRGWALLNLGGLIGVGGAHGRRRRLDMLADEDARQFDIDYAFHDEEGYEWRYRNSRPHRGKRRRGTGGSSVSVESDGTGQSLWNGIRNASVISLRNVGAALGMTATASSAAAHEGRGREVNPSEWWEKEELSLDPFKDPADGLAEVDSMAVRTDASQSNGGHTASKFSNPFRDQGEVEGHVAHAKDNGTTSLLGEYHDEGIVSAVGGELPESSQSSLSRSFAMTGIARVGTASPGPSEHVGSTSVESHDAPSGTSQSSSSRGAGVNSSSTDHSTSTKGPSSPRTKTIIGIASTPSAPMRRSDSWWSRFSRTSFLDRHSVHDALHQRPAGVGGLAEFRDPNPPPRLGPIQESLHPGSEPSLDASSPTVTDDAAKGKPQKKGSGYAASTRSSIKTVDSELIERMDGRMEVVQRALSHISRGTASPTTTMDSLELQDDMHKWRLPPLKPTSFDPSDQWLTTPVGDGESSLAESPTDHPAGDPTPASDTGASATSSSHVLSRSGASTSTSRSSSTSQRTEYRPPRRVLTGAVAARVSAYERRMSQDACHLQSPVAQGNSRPKDREEDRSRRGSVGYGLVPKAPLFVANPDHRKPSEESS